MAPPPLRLPSQYADLLDQQAANDHAPPPSATRARLSPAEQRLADELVEAFMAKVKGFSD